MLGTFLSHQWKQTRRSPVFQKSLVVNIILGFLIVYFALIFVMIGLFADKVLLKLYPNQSPVDSLNSFLLYYFLVDLFLRFMLQDLPVLAVQHYLHLPVGRKRLIHFTLLRSLPSLFNLIMLLVLVPFMWQAIIPAFGLGIALVWLATFMLLTFCNNYLLIYFKRQLTNNPKLTLFFGAAVAGLVLLDYRQVFSLQQISVAVFANLIQHPWLILIPALLLTCTYWMNFNFLRQHLYPEEISLKKATSVTGGDITFLNRFGDTGRLIALEIKLIWRHKRPRSIVFLSGIFLFYGLIFYQNQTYMEGYVMLIFVGIFVTGSPMFNYGQFVPGWQSSHFDALLTRPIPATQYMQAKYWLLVPSVLLAFVLSLPYAFFGYKVILINLAACLFNIGINSFIIFYFAVLNKERLDLSSGSAFNWQGVGASKFVMMLPMIFLPLLLFAPFAYFDKPMWGVFAIGFTGLLGFIFHKPLLAGSTSRFVQHKYKLAAGFRQV